MPTTTLSSFAGLDLRDDPQEQPGAVDLLNVELDQLGRLRSRDGYAKVTASAGATRYDSVFAVAGSASVSSSAKFPGTGADDATVGTVAWTNPGNILATDGVFATATLASGQVTHYLKATNFGFAIPGTASVVGIALEVVRQANNNRLVDSSVKLVKGGVISGNDNASPAGWPGGSSTKTYGGSSDLWGLTLTPADVNSATFGAVLAVTSRGSSIASVDSVKITVYYLPLANLAVAGAAGSRLDVLDTSGAVAATLATASDTLSTYVAFGSPATSATYIANSGTTIRKLVGTTFSTPAGMPKAKFVAITSPSNRLVAANVNQIPGGAGSTASTSLVHFSDAGAPETWSANNYVYLTPGDNEDIRGVCTWRTNTIVFKSTKFFVFYGESTDSAGQPVFNYRRVDGAGMVAPLGVAVSPAGVYFLDRRGIYFTSGGPPSRISSPVDPLWQGGAPDVYQGGTINPSAIGQASMAWFADRLYVGLPLGSATTNSHTLVYDPSRQTWVLWDIPMGAVSPTAAQPARLLFTYAQGTNDLGQYAQHAYTDDAGAAINSRYRTGFFDFGIAEQEKWIRAMYLSGDGTVNVKTAVNDTVALSAATSAAMGTNGTARWSQGTRGRNISVEVSASTAWELSHLSLDVAATRAPGVRAA